MRAIAKWLPIFAGVLLVGCTSQTKDIANKQTTGDKMGNIVVLYPDSVGANKSASFFVDGRFVTKISHKQKYQQPLCTGEHTVVLESVLPTLNSQAAISRQHKTMNVNVKAHSTQYLVITPIQNGWDIKALDEINGKHYQETLLDTSKHMLNRVTTNCQ